MIRADITTVYTPHGKWQVFTFLGLDAQDVQFFLDRDRGGISMRADGRRKKLSRAEAVQVGAAIAFPIAFNQL